jgi:hypothetical protein
MSHCDGATLIYIPPPRWGILVWLALGIPLWLVPLFLAKLGAAQSKAGAKPVSIWIWIVGISIFCITLLIVAVILRKWPHLRCAWFRRTNILVEPGRLVMGSTGFTGKSEVAYEPAAVNPTASHVEIRAGNKGGAVEIWGAGGSSRFGEALSDAERDWLVETINRLLKLRSSALPANRKAAPQRQALKSFDAFQIAADSPIVIDGDDAETLRFHYARRRGVAIWIVALLLMACSLGCISPLFRGADRQHGGNDAMGRVIGIVIGVMIVAIPGFFGLALVAARHSIALTSDELAHRIHLGPIGAKWKVSTREIDAITTLDFADRADAARFKNRTALSKVPEMAGCLIRLPSKHRVVPTDNLVAPVVRSLLLGKLGSWGRDVSNI